jgi:hypothetical protein
VTERLETKDIMDHSGRVKFLSEISFGQPVAEQEIDRLKKELFLETDTWKSITRDEIDLILGDKGSGKSALFLLLQDQKIKILIDNNIWMLNAENISGDTVFSNIVSTPPKSIREMEIIWYTYFLSIIGRFILSSGMKGKKAKSLIEILSSAGIVTDRKYKLSEILFSIRGFAEKVVNGEFSISLDQNTSLPVFSYKLNPNVQVKSVQIQYDAATDRLYKIADEILSENDLKCWILLDRLDVAFEESSDLERNALKALLKTYNKMQNLNSMKLKIFLRSDIFEKITKDGFRELSHITPKKMEILWNKESIVHLLAVRIASNTKICDLLSIDRAQLKVNFEKQVNLVEKILPPQIEIGSKKSNAFDWIYKRLADGKGQVFPRDFIYLFNEALRLERKQADIGKKSVNSGVVFSAETLKEAFKFVSTNKRDTVLYAEYPLEKKYMARLEGGKTEYSFNALCSIWGQSTDDTEKIVNKLMALGFFVRKTDIRTGYIVIPFLYRPALNLKQGKHA